MSAYTTTPLSEITPSLDLRPLLEYRQLCTQLVGGIVAGDPALIERAEKVRDELERWSAFLANFVDEQAAFEIMAALSGGSPMGLALHIHKGWSMPIEPDHLHVPAVTS